MEHVGKSYTAGAKFPANWGEIPQLLPTAAPKWRGGCWFDAGLNPGPGHHRAGRSGPEPRPSLPSGGDQAHPGRKPGAGQSWPRPARGVGEAGWAREEGTPISSFPAINSLGIYPGEGGRWVWRFSTLWTDGILGTRRGVGSIRDFPGLGSHVGRGFWVPSGVWRIWDSGVTWGMVHETLLLVAITARNAKHTGKV